MRRFASLLLTAMIVIFIIVSFVAIRAGLRLHALNKVLKIPGTRERANVVPTAKRLGASTLTNEVNLGYAIFGTSSTNRTSVQSTGSSGAVLIVSNSQFQIALLPPFGAKPTTNWSVGLNMHPRLAEYMKKMQVDPIAADIEMEEEHELPLGKLALMSHDDFLYHSILLAEKACFSRGRNEVYSFTTPRTKGIVRIGDSAQDRRITSAYIASLDGRVRVGFHLSLAAAVSADIGQALDEILGSFRFTTNNVSNGDAVSNLIYSAGIRRRTESKPDGPTAGSNL